MSRVIDTLDEDPLSTQIALLGTIAFISYLIKYASGPFVENKHIAVYTNLAFVIAGMFREFIASYSPKSVMTAQTIMGPSGQSFIMFLFLGAASFGFHAKQQDHWEHILDVCFGWFFVLHVAYVITTVLVLSKIPTWARTSTRAVFALLYMCAIFYMMSHANEIHNHQKIIMISLAVTAAVSALLMRTLMRCRSTRFDVLLIFETVVVMLAAFTAVVAQCELMPKTVHYDSFDTDPLNAQNYDLYHGNWHFLLALVASLLYTRAEQFAQSVLSKKPVDICSLSPMAVIGKVILVIYCVLLLVMKETKTDVNIARFLLALASSAFLGYAISHVFFVGQKMIGKKM